MRVSEILETIKRYEAELMELEGHIANALIRELGVAVPHYDEGFKASVGLGAESLDKLTISIVATTTTPVKVHTAKIDAGIFGKWGVSFEYSQEWFEVKDENKHIVIDSDAERQHCENVLAHLRAFLFNLGDEGVL